MRFLRTSVFQLKAGQLLVGGWGVGFLGAQKCHSLTLCLQRRAEMLPRLGSSSSWRQ